MKSLSQAIRLAAAGALVVTSVSLGYVQYFERTLAECRAIFAAVADKPGTEVIRTHTFARSISCPADKYFPCSTNAPRGMADPHVVGSSLEPDRDPGVICRLRAPAVAERWWAQHGGD
jgi:hypothetical protein